MAIIVDQDMVNAIMRAKGQRNLTINDLSKETGVSRFTLSALFNKKRVKMRKTTLEKLQKWLYKQIAPLNNDNE